MQIMEMFHLRNSSLMTWAFYALRWMLFCYLLPVLPRQISRNWFDRNVTMSKVLILYFELEYVRPFVFINSCPRRQNGHHFSDDIYICIFVNEKCCIFIKKLLTFVPKGPINNNPVLVQIMAWRRIGDKPLSEPIMTQFTDAYMRRH